MYTIIGGDQKEYGPISEDDVRQWISEGRLNHQSMMKGEGETEFRLLETFPEFTAALGVKQPIPKLPPSAFAIGASDASEPGTALREDYELDLGGCITRGWNLFKNNFGVLLVSLLVLALVCFAFFVILGLITAVVVPKHLMAVAGFKVGFNLLLSALASFVIGPLFGGLYFVYLNLIRDLPTSIGDIFSGFQKSFLQLTLGCLAVTLVTGLCMAPFSYINTAKLGPLLAQMQSATPGEVQNLSQQLITAVASVLPIWFICMIPVMYLSVNWIFTLPLIVDKQTDFWTAMKASWKMVHKHWWHVFGLVVITGLLNVAGFFACCIGLLFTIPIGFAALMFAYETIFSEEPAA